MNMTNSFSSIRTNLLMLKDVFTLLLQARQLHYASKEEVEMSISSNRQAVN